MKTVFYKNTNLDTAFIKQSIDPSDFYEYEGQEITKHEKESWKLAGLCPFHADRHSGSFFIQGNSGAFRCFSCDAKGGDIIAFIQKKYEMSFKEAIKKLKSDWRLS